MCYKPQVAAVTLYIVGKRPQLIRLDKLETLAMLVKLPFLYKQLTICYASYYRPVAHHFGVNLAGLTEPQNASSLQLEPIMIQERRQTDKDMHHFWEELNLAQKFSVAELQRYGYELKFVRQENNRKTAVLFAGRRMAAIDDDGQIDTQPTVVMRH
jgi:hypothetical protein